MTNMYFLLFSLHFIHSMGQISDFLHHYVPQKSVIQEKSVIVFDIRRYREPRPKSNNYQHKWVKDDGANEGSCGRGDA